MLHLLYATGKNIYIITTSTERIFNFVLNCWQKMKKSRNCTELRKSKKI